MSSSNPRPILTLHVGQAGIQIGHAVWELLCLEHNINPDGSPKLECGDHGNVDTVFLTSKQGHHCPRSIFVDTDPFCIDEIRSGPYHGLFNSRQLLSDQLDSGNNYATGRYAYAKSLLPDIMDRLRWLFEKTDAKPTVCLVHSACGGTGSGLSVACLSRAADELGLTGQSTLDFCVVPGRTAVQNSCELLNTALYLDESHDLVRQTFCVSNSALFRVCTAQLQSNGRATYAHINRILAAAFSNLTATERLPGASVNLYSILDSLLPFQHLKYPLLACAPFLTAEDARIDQLSAKSSVAAVLEPGSQFLDVNPRKGRHAAGFLLFRGDVTASEAQALAAQLTLQGRVQFHDWAPAGFRTGLLAPPPLAPPGSGFNSAAVSVTMVTSHSGLSEVFASFALSARRLHEADLFVQRYEGAIVALLKPEGNESNATDSGSGVGDSGGSGGGGGGGGGVSHWMSQDRRQPSGRASNERTCALSDVFGVRVRLAVAIDYLERVADVYAETGPSPPEAMARRGSGALGGPDEDRLLHDLTGSPVNSLVLSMPVDHIDTDGAGEGGENGKSPGESENAVRWHQVVEGNETTSTSSQEPPEPQDPQQQQQSQSQNQPMNSASPVSSSTSNDSTCGRSQPTLRSQLKLLSFGCLRRKAKQTASRQQQQLRRQFSWSPRSKSDCHSAIAEAERVLMKYRFQDEQ